MSADYHSFIQPVAGEVRRSYVVPWPCDDREFEALTVLEQVLREVPPEACARLLEYMLAKHGSRER